METFPAIQYYIFIFCSIFFEISFEFLVSVKYINKENKNNCSYFCLLLY